MPKRTKLDLRCLRTVEDSLIRELETEVHYLRRVIRSQADMIAELQCRIDPYSQDGKPVCNSFKEKD